MARRPPKPPLVSALNPLPAPSRQPAEPRIRLHARGRRREAADSDDEEETQAGRPWLPKVVFVLLLVLLATMVGVEVRNGLRHPSVRRVAPPAGASALTFYQKGQASAREAWLFDEPQGTAGPPRLIQRIDCRLQATAIGEIRWTADGRAVYAAGRDPSQRGVPVVRWLFEMDPPEGKPTGKGAPGKKAPAASLSPPEGRLYLSGPEYALPGRTAFVEDPTALTNRWRQHGGAGMVASVWYDLGAMGPPLFSWQTTRWENRLPD